MRRPLLQRQARPLCPHRDDEDYKLLPRSIARTTTTSSHASFSFSRFTMSRRPPQTLTDYVLIGLNPALIMLLVGSLVFFLLEAFYHGAYDFRLRFIFAMYVMGIVSVSRISIEEGSGYASMFGAPLAVVAAMAMGRFVTIDIVSTGFSTLLNWSLLGLVWWSANKLTWDCTVIDENEDASGQGLLQAMGIDRLIQAANPLAPAPAKVEEPEGDMSGIAAGTTEAPRGTVATGGRATAAGTGKGAGETSGQASPSAGASAAPGAGDDYSILPPEVAARLRAAEESKKAAAPTMLGDAPWLKWWNKRRKHSSKAPGQTVVYFSLAALPLFGFGQLAIPSSDDASHATAAKFLGVYLASGLTLLASTSFLNLRRYLRKRSVEMPAQMTVTWIFSGAVLILALLLATSMLPRPRGGGLLGAIASSPALNPSKWGFGNDGPQSQSGQRTGPQSQPGGQQPGGQQQNGGQQQSGGQPQNGGPQQGGGQQPPSQQPGGQQQGGQPQGGGRQPNGQQTGGQQGGSQPSGRPSPNGPQQSGQQSGSQQGGQQKQGGPSPMNPQSAGGQNQSQTPGRQQPGQQQPGQQQPGQQQPGNQQPGQQQPGQQQPGQNQPGQNQPMGPPPGNGSPPPPMHTGPAPKPGQTAPNSQPQPNSPSQTNPPQNQPPSNSQPQNSPPSNSQRPDGSPDNGKSPPGSAPKQLNKSNGANNPKSADNASNSSNSNNSNSGNQNNASNSSSQTTNSGAAGSLSNSSSNSSSIGSTLEKLSSSVGSAVSLLKWLIYPALILGAFFLAWRYREQLARFWEQLVRDWRAFWARWTGRPVGDDAETPVAAAPPPRPPRLADFPDPFATGAANRSTPAELVRYSFAALEAWGWERGCPRPPEQTPLEFAQTIGRQEEAVARPARNLAEWYNQLAYAGGNLPPTCVPQVRQLWEAFHQPSPPPPPTPRPATGRTA